MRIAPFAMMAVICVSAVEAQQAPRRPRLGGDADTNDAVAYFQFGLDRLVRNARDAAAAFYWAQRLDPASPQILYARHTALLLSNSNRLVDYVQRDPRTMASLEVRQIDSLYLRALMQDPFLQRGLEEVLLMAYLRRAMSQDAFTWAGQNSSPSDGDLLRAMDTVFAEYRPMLRGLLAYSRGNPREALLYYRRALRIRGAHADIIHLHRATSFFALRQMDSAKVAMATAIDSMRSEDTTEIRLVYESKAQWEFALGRIMEEQRDWAGAREAYQRAIVEDLAYFPAHQRLGQLALAAGDTAGAITEFERAVEVNENEYLSRAFLGAMLGRLGRNREAAVHLRRATELEPWAAAPWLLLGRELDRMSDTTAAIAAYDRYVNLTRRADPPRAAARARAGELRAARP